VISYFFFDFKDEQKQDHIRMIKSIIYQLSQKCIKVPVSLDNLFSSCNNNKQQQPFFDELLHVLQETLQQFPKVCILLDTLDECSERQELMETIDRLLRWELRNLHVLLTSRKEREIESCLARFVRAENAVNLKNEEVDEDIRIYVKEELFSNRSLSKWHQDQSVQKEIETALTDGAHGMYVYSPNYIRYFF
jgi:hypothetical protein